MNVKNCFSCKHFDTGRTVLDDMCYCKLVDGYKADPVKRCKLWNYEEEEPEPPLARNCKNAYIYDPDCDECATKGDAAKHHCYEREIRIKFNN